MELYAGIDLHSTNNFVGIIDEDRKRLFGKRLINDKDLVLTALGRFEKDLREVVVESTFNWYWLVDALMEKGYRMRLANPAAIQQYSGLKHTDDESDAIWLAEMARLKILPEGYIYPKELRATRDLLRRRLMFVRHKTAHHLSLKSLKSMIARNPGIQMSGNSIKKLKRDDAAKLFDSPYLISAAQHQIAAIGFLGLEIAAIEKEVLGNVKLREEFRMLLTVPGIGDVLAMTIMLEVGDIGRFEKVGNYSSYCRCVDSRKTSNRKKKGEGNRKNGNKHLGWAYVEASNFARRFCLPAPQFFQRKSGRKNAIPATKALSNKLCRASYYMRRDGVPFDEGRLFS